MPYTRFVLASGPSLWWQSADSTHGWAYAMSGIEAYRVNSDPTAILLDSYVDRTFSPEFINTPNTLLPYSRPWIGFVHHTFDTTFSLNNCVTLFQTAKFLSSLPMCKGLIALSVTLKNALKTALTNAGYPNVPVFSLTHPVRFPSGVGSDTGFLYSNLTSNPSPYLIQVGYWLRNHNAVASFTLSPYNTLRVTKAALLSSATAGNNPSSPPQDDVADEGAGSGYGGSAISPAVAAANQVTIIPYVPSYADYMTLINNNIVFINLVDASAVNTVLECIASNTPIIVNRLPALEEVLGSDYSGFYTNLSEVPALITTFKGLRPLPYTMNLQLSRLDKTRFQLMSFTSSFQTLLSQLV